MLRKNKTKINNKQQVNFFGLRDKSYRWEKKTSPKEWRWYGAHPPHALWRHWY